MSGCGSKKAGVRRALYELNNCKRARGYQSKEVEFFQSAGREGIH